MAKSRISSFICAHVQVCQTPRAFSRMAGRAANRAEFLSSSFGTVSCGSPATPGVVIAATLDLFFLMCWNSRRFQRRQAIGKREQARNRKHAVNRGDEEEGRRVFGSACVAARRQLLAAPLTAACSLLPPARCLLPAMRHHAELPGLCRCRIFALISVLACGGAKSALR